MFRDYLVVFAWVLGASDHPVIATDAISGRGVVRHTGPSPKSFSGFWKEDMLVDDSVFDGPGGLGLWFRESSYCTSLSTDQDLNVVR